MTNPDKDLAPIHDSSGALAKTAIGSKAIHAVGLNALSIHQSISPPKSFYREILCIEDDITFQEIITDYCEIFLDKKCIITANATTALDHLKTDPTIGVALLDFAFDYHDLHFASGNHDDEHESMLKEMLLIRPDLKIIVTTGIGDEENLRRSLKAGAFDWLARPFSFSELNRSIRKALEILELDQTSSLEVSSPDLHYVHRAKSRLAALLCPFASGFSRTIYGLSFSPSIHNPFLRSHSDRRAHRRARGPAAAFHRTANHLSPLNQPHRRLLELTAPRHPKKISPPFILCAVKRH